jgi:hypothetical protein
MEHKSLQVHFALRTPTMRIAMQIQYFKKLSCVHLNVQNFDNFVN